jgi:hypothetical protein
MIKQKKEKTREADKEIDAFLRFFKDTLNHFKKISKVILIMLILLFLNVGIKYPVMSEPIDKITKIENNFEIQYPKIVRQRLHEKLVNEVKIYIETMAPTSKINPEFLVTMCQKYNMNITFVLAQGLLESHFGTRGRAAITNSIFNVGSWDGGKVLYTYKNVNESIEPYMQLLKEEYLVDKKLAELIQDKGYKNTGGHRYATSLLYEQSLRTLMVNIDMQTSIKMYQDVMNLSDNDIMTFFGPIKNEQINIEQLQANNNDTIKRTIQ